jgi:hypothetical protein
MTELANAVVVPIAKEVCEATVDGDAEDPSIPQLALPPDC